MKLPHIVSYTRKVEAVKALAFYIRINPKFKERKGLYAHEYEHVKQWYISMCIIFPLWCVIYYYDHTIASFLLPMLPVIFGIAKKLFKPLRYAMELRAFAAHLRYEPALLDWAANALANDYGLSVKPEKVKADLQKLLKG